MQPSLPQEHLHSVPEPETNAADADADADDDEVRVATHVQAGAAALYIDTDNQSPLLVQPLLNTLGEHLDVPIAEITIAGNNVGKRLDQWRDQLTENEPAVCLEVLDVPARKEAADIALILELGSNLGRHIDERHLIIVMSRDALLIGAAEQARARGARVLLAYGDSAMPSSENSELTTLLLPSLSKSRSVIQAATQPVTQPAIQPAPDSAINTLSSIVPTVDSNSVVSVVAGLHQMCPEQPGGGYQPTHVGQALVKLGFAGAAARKKFLKSVPNLVTRGEGAEKRLVF